jgi:S-DNA-T family DNA segregation ATPase FtsK/SpoIIIE
MARKKKMSNKGIYTIVGIIMCLLSFAGLFRFGPVGEAMAAVACVLVGNIWYVFYVIIFCLSVYFVLQGEKPDFFSAKVAGVIIAFLAGVMILHLNMVNVSKPWQDGFVSIIKNYSSYLNAEWENLAFNNGGGVLGYLLDYLFINLFAFNGTKVISWVLFLIGMGMFTGFTIWSNFVNAAGKVGDKVKGGLSKLSDRDREEVKKVENDYEDKTTKKGKVEVTEPSAITVTSASDLHVAKPDLSKVDLNNNGIPDVQEEEEKIVDESGYHLPSIDLISENKNKSGDKVNRDTVNKTIPILEGVFHDFDLDAKVVKVHIGPAVSQYELTVPNGTKLSRILGINREIALALSAKDVRIEAPIPGKNTIGVEVPNKNISMVGLREILEAVPAQYKDSKLLACLGLDIMGNPKYMEINKMPHLLVAGATGSGKSVCINSIILSIIMRTKPSEVKLVLIDPKKVELSMYNGEPHLKTPVVTDAKQANVVLKHVVAEMENRYDRFESSGTKNIAGYNMYVEKHNANSDDKLVKMPFIVVIVDELADLMMVAGKEVQDSIMRITQMARAAGIHLIVATQRPSTDVITGVIKANIPSRISFAVASSIDSRTILDMMGAEKLLGKGDMLFLPEGENAPTRIQGAFVSDDDIKKVVDANIKQQKAQYDESFNTPEGEPVASTDPMHNNDDYDEPLYNDMVDFVIQQKEASASALQRRFRIGYNRAANAIALLEKRGIVGPRDGAKPRKVLVNVAGGDDNE